MLVTKIRSRLLDAGTFFQYFNRIILLLFNQPHLGAFAHLLKEMPFQCPHRNAALLRQGGD